MRLIAFALVVTAVPATAAEPTAPPVAAVAAVAPVAPAEKLICTRERPLGSMVSVKHCVTARQQAQNEANAQKALDQRAVRVER